MNNQKFNLKTNTFSIDSFFAMCVSCFWIFVLAVKRWMSASLFLTFAISLLILVRNKKHSITFFPKNTSENWLIWLSIALAAPFLAVLFAQLLRQDFYVAGYDSSFRFFVTIPILYTIIHNKIDTLKFFEYTIPAAIFITLLSVLFHPNQHWGEERLTTYFVDPILFGSINVTLALMSLISINLYKNDSLLVKLFKLSGFLVGIYLSVISGSRTGWAAIPIVLLLWIYIKFNGKHLLISLIAVFFFMSVLFFIPVVQQRTHIALNEILSYHWSNLNTDTSVGTRISMIRIGLFLFSQNIFSGWGDGGFKELINAPEICQFASAATRGLSLTAGFHNEIIANMVRSGIWGFISMILIFLVPFCFFIKGLFSNSVIIRNHALIAISYLICVFISGISIEVFSSKLTASFYAMLMVNLIGSLWVVMHSEQHAKNL